MDTLKLGIKRFFKNKNNKALLKDIITTKNKKQKIKQVLLKNILWL